MKRICIIVWICWSASSFATPRRYTTEDYVRVLKHATDVMVSDVTSPVAASRYYAYITLAGNEAMSAYTAHKQFSFAAKLKNWQPLQIESTIEKEELSSLAVLYTMYRMAMRLLPSGPVLQARADSLCNHALSNGCSSDEITKIRQRADQIIEQLLRYYLNDHFRELSSFTRYTPTQGDAYWQPTAPGYMQALEPNWNTLRPLLMRSADQFKPAECAKFDTVSTSTYYKQLREVYDIGRKLTRSQKEIASFWDCNPFALQQIGHIEFGLKKISPGGHWMGIAGIACRKANKSFRQSVLIHSMVAIALYDAFISCWDEKYRSNRVRPETAIRKWIDPCWKPFLQTPPFPEYTSGHSVASNAAATILTAVFGDKFSYTDTTEIEFGLPARRFNSFTNAAAEAAISRLYGGIHYRDAIENGTVQGRAVGEHALRQLTDWISLAQKAER
jgi:hypothetical protein